MTFKKDIEHLSIRVGIMTAMALAAYFLMMKALGLVYILELRVLNFIIILFAVIYALKRFVAYSHYSILYLQGLAVGCLTTFYSVIFFAVFIGVYLKLDPDFMAYVRETAWFGDYLTPLSAAFAVFAEGTTSGFVITFISMQYFKRYAVKSAL